MQEISVEDLLEVLAANGFEITFVDVNHTIIDALNERKEYEIELADESKEKSL